MSPDDDRDAVARCLEGDEGAFAELFRRHEARALRLAFGLLGDREAAEDAKQEAFLHAFRSLGRMNADVAFTSWLYQNVVWAARTQLRRAHRRHEVAASAAPAGDGRAELERQELRTTMVGALQALPPAAREVVALRFYLDLTEAEIARVLGCRGGTVKSRLSRALRRLAASPALVDLRQQRGPRGEESNDVA
jgi:RNA polymerase sigma-70 factor (ECF subfamily)